MNFAIKVAQSSSYDLNIWPITTEIRRYGAFFDASFDPAGEKNQLGRLIGVTTRDLNDGKVAKVSVNMWKSQTMGKKAGSPNATETESCMRAVADLTWYRALVESMTWSDFDLETQRRKGISSGHGCSACHQ